MNDIIREAISISQEQPLLIEIRNGRLDVVQPITDPQRAERIRRRQVYVSPGFVDLQVNGLKGLDYSGPELKAPQVRDIIENLASMGTTMHAATVITAPPHQIERSLRTIARARADDEVVHRAIPGIHVEGPFISDQDGPRGAHHRDNVRNPSIAEYETWQEAANGAVRIVTLAPERKGTLPFIERLVRDGVVVSIGHTDASPEQIGEAIQAGASMSTHLGNGSSVVLPRLRNCIWEQLAADSLVAGIIADGVHLPAAVLRVFSRVKGTRRLVLVSDIAPMAGMAPDEYSWGETRVVVHQDGHLSVAGTPYLAGASAGLDTGVGVFRKATGWKLARVVSLCTRNSARILRVPRYPYRIERGAAADVTFFRYDHGSDTMRVLETIISGQVIKDCSSPALSVN